MTEITDLFAVWDDVLSPDDFEAVVDHVLAQKYALSIKEGCMLSDTIFIEQTPTHGPLDPVFEAMTDACVMADRLCGQWNRLGIATHVYQPSTRSVWDQCGEVTLIYYCHPTWEIGWGGELLISKTPLNELDYGIGHVIIPKPNRLVLMRANVARKVTSGLDARICMVGSVSLFPQAKEQSESLGIHSSTDQRLQAKTQTADARAA